MISRPLLIGAIVLVVIIVAAAVWLTRCGNRAACAQCKLAKIRDGDPPRPGCSAEDGWAVFRGAMTDQPQGEALSNSGSGSPMPDAACRNLCAANPACKSWVNDQKTAGGCTLFPTVPQTISGLPGWTVGVRGSAIR